ncbi:MAG TPA: DUF6011 domain-containing protein [Streptomyces sp.]|nr:DUF6011 domain-containing protein [Streptomyces sp.]
MTLQLPLPDPDAPAEGEHQEEQGVLFDFRAPVWSGAVPRVPRAAVLPSRAQGALFGLEDLGTDARIWAQTATAVRARRCEMCGRSLRSAASRAAGVGPGCAAKRGRAVVSSVRLARSARRRRHLQAVPAA